MMDMDLPPFYGYEAKHPEALHGIEARREKHPYFVEQVDEYEIEESMDGGIKQVPVHEPYPMKQQHFRPPIPGQWPRTPQQFEIAEPKLRQDEGGRPQQHVPPKRVSRKYQCKDQCKEEIEKLKAAIKALQVTDRNRKMELFNSWKSAGDFDKAEKYYEDILANDLVEADCAQTATMILDLQQSYVDMLIKQGGRFEKALDLAKEVWDKIKGDPVPETSRECHRQLCLIYSSLKRPEEAERMHKLAYEGYKGREDAWALENGDECCKKLAEQQNYDEAALMQAKVWTERQQRVNGGPRHPDTIKSGKSRIFWLEKQSVTLAAQAGSESETNLRRSERETCEYKIDQALQYLWDTAENPERNTDILDAGHRLGARHLAAKRLPEAKAVLTHVWKDGKHVFGEGDDKTISVGIDLAATLDLLGQYSSDGGAEEVYEWVLEQNQSQSRLDDSTVRDVRYNLGRAMYHQGQAKYAQATVLLQAVYDQWYETSPDAVSIRECGRLLVEMYEHQRAVEPIKALFEGRKRLESRCMLYLQSGHAYGKLLMNQDDHGLARDLLKSLWECDATLVTEKESRLRCGCLYGESLVRLGDNELAQVILRSVAEAQDGVFIAGTPEANKVSELLGQAQQAASARTSPKLGAKTAKGATKPRNFRMGDNRHVTSRADKIRLKV